MVYEHITDKCTICSCTKVDIRPYPFISLEKGTRLNNIEAKVSKNLINDSKCS